MVLPSKFSPSHELFDLQQLPATSIDPIAKDLRISYLNQIQTQTYSAFVNSNDNLFLGAS